MRTLSNDEVLHENLVNSNRSGTESVSALKGLLSDEQTEPETQKGILPNMWSWNYIGLYCQYAAVGLLYGSSGTIIPFCVYSYNGG